MIKKLLQLILVCILAVGVFNSWAHGFSFQMFGANIDVSSYSGIAGKSQNLSNKVNELERKNTTEFDSAIKRKDSAVNFFNTTKTEYDTLALEASLDEIKEANKEEEYFLDYLWMKLGTYADNNDIKWIPEINYEAETIDFDITGPYIAVINFIYDLENDPELAFNIDNLVMQGGSSATVTKAAFQVRNVKVLTSQVTEQE